FLSGLSAAATPDRSTEYPLATTVSRSRVSTQPCSIAPGLARRVVIERLADRGAAITAIRDAARAGAAVAWVRNAVDDAIEAVEALRATGLDASLFHARFAMGERQDIEAKVLSWFGP